MQNYARLCGLHCNEDTQGLQTRGNLGLRSPTNRQHSDNTAIHAYFGPKITLLSLIFRRWKNFIIRQNIFSSGSMCRCILLDKIVHDKHNNKLHWTRVEQTIMHNYAQLCTIMQFGPIVNYAKLCTIMHVHNFPPPAFVFGQCTPLLTASVHGGTVGVCDTHANVQSSTRVASRAALEICEMISTSAEASIASCRTADKRQTEQYADAAKGGDMRQSAAVDKDATVQGAS